MNTNSDQTKGNISDKTIEIKNLCKSYGGLAAVDNLSITVNRGEAFGLLGSNGAGKSTVIECALGTRKQEGGWVQILGMNPKTHRNELFEKVGVQFQESDYQDKIKVRELCEVTQSLYRASVDYGPLLKRFGLEGKAENFVSELSGGQKQRLFIVLALLPDPQVIFLDELTTGLDAKARRQVWRYLSDLKESGVTIFLTSHFMDEVENLCDHICILKNGRSAFCGTVAEAIDASPYETLEEAYLWFTGEEEIEYESI